MNKYTGHKRENTLIKSKENFCYFVTDNRVISSQNKTQHRPTEHHSFRAVLNILSKLNVICIFQKHGLQGLAFS